MNVSHLSLACLRDLKRAIEQAMSSHEKSVNLPYVGEIEVGKLSELLRKLNVK